MQPRKDPETAPVQLGVQFIRRADPDRYGAEYSRAYAEKNARVKPMVTRNGLPWKPYVYRGTGRDRHPETALWTQVGGYRPRRERPCG
jgi:hypothetical protein